MSKEEDVARLKSHVQALIEHFDTVQIFCSRHMPAEANGTVSLSEGAGNWLARRGHVHDWTLYCDEYEKEKARRAHDQ
jgi:hypothetical protein